MIDVVESGEGVRVPSDQEALSEEAGPVQNGWAPGAGRRDCVQPVSATGLPVDPEETMIVKYSCVCGINRVAVEVPDRGDVEDVVHWVSVTVATRIGADHGQRSPHCNVRKMREVLIPLPPGTESLGKPVKN